MKKWMLLLILVALPSLVSATANEEDKCMLFGTDHAFFVSAIPGWVLDNKSGVSRGIDMLFYPEGETWSGSPVIVYGKSVSKAEFPTITSQFERTIEQFRNSGSPDYVGEKKMQLELKDGKTAVIYYFSGDQWGNYEAAAYIEEVESINFLVFNARTKEVFDKYIEDFNKFVKTYSNTYTPANLLNESGADRLISEAKAQLKVPGGKEYETELMQAAGQEIAKFMMTCISYLPGQELPKFHLFIRIEEDGLTSEIMVYPSNALSVCFKGSMSGMNHPPHSFGSFLLDLEMAVVP